MKIFKTDQVQQLSMESELITDVFISTLQSLEDANERIDIEFEKRGAQINKLRTEQGALRLTSNKNKQLLDKIKDFLS